MMILGEKEAKAKMYEAAAAAMRQPLFSATSTVRSPAAAAIGHLAIDRIVTDLNDLIENATALRDRVTAASSGSAETGSITPTRRTQEAQSGGAFDDLARPMDIVRAFDISRAHLHRLCKDHRISADGSIGFAFWTGNRFLISEPRFALYARSNGVRRRETK